MAVLIRKILMITTLSISISIHALDNISVFCNIGQTLPLFSYSSATKSDNAFEIAEIADFAKSFSFGADKKYKGNFGFCTGFLYRELGMDKSKFEDIHKDEGFEVKSYLHHLSEHYNFSFYIGLFREINFKKISTKPKITIGYSIINSDFSEIYFLNENNIVRTKTYEYDINDNIVLGIGGDLNYTFFEDNFLKIKLHLQTFVNWQTPKIEVYIRESDYASNSIDYYKEEHRQVICTLYYALGLVVYIF